MFKGRRAALILLTLGVCASCVHPKDANVLVNPLQTDIVFGLSPSTTVAPAPGQPSAPLPATSNATPGVTFPLSPEPPISLPLTLKKVNTCPAAALDAFPDQTAPITVSSLPPVGLYRWELGGVKVVGPVFTSLEGEEKRLVRRAVAIPKIQSDNADSLDYTFQTLEPFDAKGSILQTTYQVRSDNLGSRFVQPQTGVNASVYVVTPDSGLSILSEDVISANGGITPLFHPLQPLLILPLPIRPGGQFTTVAADTASGQVTILQASVVRRARVDACGTIIEGWEVAGIERVVGGSAATITNPTVDNAATFIDDVFATQFGGMPIAQHTVQASPSMTTDVDDAIGQEKPSPLPAGTA